MHNEQTFKEYESFKFHNNSNKSENNEKEIVSKLKITNWIDRWK